MGLFDSISDGISGAVHSVGDVASSAVHSVEDTAKKASQALSDEAHAVMSTASSVVHTVEDAGSTVVHGIETAAHAVDDAEAWVGHQALLFGEGVVTGAILNPINAVEQIVDHVTGWELPPLELPNQAEVNNSWAGKAGVLTGTVLDFVLTDGAVSAVTGLEAGSMGALAITGALQGGILTPSAPGESNGDFFLGRLKGAAIDSVTFAVMGGVGGKVAGVLGGETAATLGGKVLSNTIGGGAAGFVQAEASSILNEGRLATGSEILNQVGTNAAFGAGFGALGHFVPFGGAPGEEPAVKGGSSPENTGGGGGGGTGGPPEHTGGGGGSGGPPENSGGGTGGNPENGSPKFTRVSTTENSETPQAQAGPESTPVSPTSNPELKPWTEPGQEPAKPGSDQPPAAQQERMTPEEWAKKQAEDVERGKQNAFDRLSDGLKDIAGSEHVQAEIAREKPILEQAQRDLAEGNVDAARDALRKLPPADKEIADFWQKNAKVDPETGEVSYEPNANNVAKLKKQIDKQLSKLQEWQDLASGKAFDEITPGEVKKLLPRFQDSLQRAEELNPRFKELADEVAARTVAYRTVVDDPNASGFFGRLANNVSPQDALEQGNGKRAVIDKVLQEHGLDTLEEPQRTIVREKLESMQAEIDKALTGRVDTNDSGLPSEYGKKPSESFKIDDPAQKAAFEAKLKELGIDPASDAVTEFMKGGSKAYEMRVVDNGNGDVLLMRFDASETMGQAKGYLLELKDGKPALTTTDGVTPPKLHIIWQTDAAGEGHLVDVKVEKSGTDKPYLFDARTGQKGVELDWSKSGFASEQEFLQYLDQLVKGITY